MGVLPMAEHISMQSRYTKQDYHMTIELPFTFRFSSERVYTTAYVLDGDLFTGILTGITRLMESNPPYPELLIVGIGYHLDGPYRDYVKSFHMIRTKDFTPTVDTAFEKTKQATFDIDRIETGGAKDFLSFLENELIPKIEMSYKSDPSNRLLFGDSLGGLFSLYTLFQKPQLFKSMIIGSPAIRYGDKLVFRLEEDYSRKKEDLSVNLFMGIGGEEETVTGPLSTISVSDLNRLASIMDSRGYRGMNLISRIFEGNDHFEVPALTIQAGLKSIFRREAA